MKFENPTASTLTEITAAKFAASTLANVVREYPYQPMHVLNGPGDLKTPRELHPIFFGCFDWHSCVHGYWQLARLHRLFPGLSLGEQIEQRIDSAFTVENAAVEVEYFVNQPAFERPYGWAWLLMLCHELSLHDHDMGRRWHRVLLNLADTIADQFLRYLPKADYPVRAGTHANSAFALTLGMEYARSHQLRSLMELSKSKGQQWYAGDQNCQAWEPSQSDFLSPALMEATCMSRVLSPTEFQEWLAGFLPNLKDREPAILFRPATPSDRTDGQIAHLDGLNLSRAWCFRSIARASAHDAALVKVLRSAADEHLQASLPHIFEHYAGEHWLATFALLACS